MARGDQLDGRPAYPEVCLDAPGRSPRSWSGRRPLSETLREGAMKLLLSCWPARSPSGSAAPAFELYDTYGSSAGAHERSPKSNVLTWTAETVSKAAMGPSPAGPRRKPVSGGSHRSRAPFEAIARRSGRQPDFQRLMAPWSKSQPGGWRWCERARRPAGGGSATRSVWCSMPRVLWGGRGGEKFRWPDR